MTQEQRLKTDVLKQLRESAKMTPKQAAIWSEILNKEVGSPCLTEDQIKMWENGEAIPTSRELSTLAFIYGYKDKPFFELVGFNRTAGENDNETSSANRKRD